MTNKTKTYADKPTESWSVNDFLAYLTDRHHEVYGIEYRPFRNWQVERGLIGGLIGTKGRSPKPRKHEPALVRKFIDECFASHRTTPQYPGVSFGWFWSYKSNVWQRVLAEDAEARRRAERAISVESVGLSAEELDGWL